MAWVADYMNGRLVQKKYGEPEEVKDMGREGRSLALPDKGGVTQVIVLPERMEFGVVRKGVDGEVIKRRAVQLSNPCVSQIKVSDMVVSEGEEGEQRYEVDVVGGWASWSGGDFSRYRVETEQLSSEKDEGRAAKVGFDQEVSYLGIGYPAVVEELSAEGVSNEGWLARYRLGEQLDAHGVMFEPGGVRVASLLPLTMTNVVSYSPMVESLPTEFEPPEDLPRGFAEGLHVDFQARELEDGQVRLDGRVVDYDLVEVEGGEALPDGFPANLVAQLSWGGFRGRRYQQAKVSNVFASIPRDLSPEGVVVLYSGNRYFYRLEPDEHFSPSEEEMKVMVENRIGWGDSEEGDERVMLVYEPEEQSIVLRARCGPSGKVQSSFINTQEGLVFVWRQVGNDNPFKPKQVDSRRIDAGGVTEGMSYAKYLSDFEDGKNPRVMQIVVMRQIE